MGTFHHDRHELYGMMRGVANDSPDDRRIEVALNWPQLLDQDD